MAASAGRSAERAAELVSGGIKERNTLIRMLTARTMMWHPLLLLDQNITLYWNARGVSRCFFYCRSARGIFSSYSWDFVLGICVAKFEAVLLRSEAAGGN